MSFFFGLSICRVCTLTPLKELDEINLFLGETCHKQHQAHMRGKRTELDPLNLSKLPLGEKITAVGLIFYEMVNHFIVAFRSF